VRGLVLALGMPRVGLKGVREESCNTYTLVALYKLFFTTFTSLLVVYFLGLPASIYNKKNY
jgi:hypothetical protein